MEHSGIASPSTIHAPFRARDDPSGAIPLALVGWSARRRPGWGAWGRLGGRFQEIAPEGSGCLSNRGGAPRFGAPPVPSVRALRDSSVQY